ncbi:MFS transporter, partial [Streptomyces althioticus]
MTGLDSTAVRQARTARAGGGAQHGPDTPVRPRATLALTSAATAVTLMNYTAPMVTLPQTAAALHTSPSAQAWLLNGTPLGLAALLL